MCHFELWYTCLHFLFIITRKELISSQAPNNFISQKIPQRTGNSHPSAEVSGAANTLVRDTLGIRFNVGKTEKPSYSSLKIKVLTCLHCF